MAIENLEVVSLILQEFDQSHDVAEICYVYNLPENVIEGLISSAKRVSRGETRYKKSRLISKKRKGKIAPAILKSKEDLLEFNTLVDLFLQDKDLKKTEKMCRFFLNRMNTAESEIRLYQPDAALRIVNYFSKNHTHLKWHLDLSLSQSLSDKEKMDIKGEWENGLQNMTVEITSEMLGETTSHDLGIGKLSLMSPRFDAVRKKQEVKGKLIKYRKLASPVLRYVCHLLLIVCHYDLQASEK